MALQDLLGQVGQGGVAPEDPSGMMKPPRRNKGARGRSGKPSMGRPGAPGASRGMKLGQYSSGLGQQGRFSGIPSNAGLGSLQANPKSIFDRAAGSSTQGSTIFTQGGTIPLLGKNPFYAEGPGGYAGDPRFNR